MSKLITVTGRSLSLSGQSHPPLNYEITETDTQATTTSAEGNLVLLQQIQLQCNCSGDYVEGTSTFVGSGNASIIASSTTVKCESKPIVLAEDKVTITCSGTVTQTSSGATSPGTASVTVTVTNTNQATVSAS